MVQVTPVCAAEIDTPGAARSGLTPLKPPTPRGPRDENEAMVSLYAQEGRVCSRDVRLDVVTVGKVTITAGMVPLPAKVPHIAKHPGRRVGDDHADGASVAGVGILDTETTSAAVDQRDIAGDGCGVISGLQPSVVNGPAPSEGSRPTTILPVCPLPAALGSPMLVLLVMALWPTL